MPAAILVGRSVSEEARRVLEPLDHHLPRSANVDVTPIPCESNVQGEVESRMSRSMEMSRMAVETEVVEFLCWAGKSAPRSSDALSAPRPMGCVTTTPTRLANNMISAGRRCECSAPASPVPYCGSSRCRPEPAGRSGREDPTRRHCPAAAGVGRRARACR